MKMMLSILLIVLVVLTGCGEGQKECPVGKEVQKEYYNSGKLYCEVTYEDGVKNGPAVWYFADGLSVDLEINMINGKMHGNSKEYYFSGELQFTSYFNNGLQEGERLEYYTTGEIKSRSIFIADFEEGLSKEYYKNGDIRGEIEISKGKWEGDYKEYYSNGNLSMITTYKNDSAIAYIEYDSLGNKVEEVRDGVFVLKDSLDWNSHH